MDYKNTQSIAMDENLELGSSNYARETYLVRMKRTYSVSNSNATCVIYYMRANKIEGNFLFFD